MPFNRLTGSLLLVVVAGVVGLGFLLNQIYDAIDTRASAVETQVYSSLGGQLAQSLSRADDLPAALARAQAATGFELSLIPKSDLPLPPSLQQTLSTGEPLLLQSQGLDHQSALSVYIAVAQTEQLLVLSGLPVEEPGDLHPTRLVLTLAFYAGLLAVVVLWLAPLLRRLDTLGRVTRAFGDGQLQQRIQSSDGSYIAAIEADFNVMADRIQALMSDNRLLSRAVSHDLKTPLARLRFGVEMLNDCDDAVERAKYAVRVEADLRQMESLIATLLDYARMEDARPALSLSRVNLQQCLEPLLIDSGNYPNLICRVACQATAIVQADARYLNMLFSNLINNACEHARSNVQVSVVRVASRWRVDIEDDGQGIPERERESVLKPFYRLGPQLRGGVEGHGIGLAIAQRLARWHGAHLSISSSASLGGARVSVLFAQ